MDDKIENEGGARKIGTWFGIGIFIFPIVFSWFTLRSGHSRISRYIAFGWLITTIFIPIIANNLPANSSLNAPATTQTAARGNVNTQTGSIPNKADLIGKWACTGSATNLKTKHVSSNSDRFVFREEFSTVVVDSGVATAYGKYDTKGTQIYIGFVLLKYIDQYGHMKKVDVSGKSEQYGEYKFVGKNEFMMNLTAESEDRPIRRDLKCTREIVTDVLDSELRVKAENIYSVHRLVSEALKRGALVGRRDCGNLAANMDFSTSILISSLELGYREIDSMNYGKANREFKEVYDKAFGYIDQAYRGQCVRMDVDKISWTKFQAKPLPRGVVPGEIEDYITSIGFTYQEKQVEPPLNEPNAPAASAVKPTESSVQQP